MHSGELLQVSDPISIYSHPASCTVADFLGYSNIFRVGEVRPAEDGHEIVLAESATVLLAATAPAEAADLFACIRPEDMAVAPSNDKHSANAPNTLLGEVILASFMGSFMQYRVRADGGETFEVYSNDILGACKLGARVRLHVPARSVHVLPRI